MGGRCAALLGAGCSGGSESSDGALSGAWIVYEGPIDCDCVDDGGAGKRLVRSDGTGGFWVTPGVPRRKNGWQVHPDWSPDGRRLAFAVDQTGEAPPNETRDIWVTDAAGQPRLRQQSDG